MILNRSQSLVFAPEPFFGGITFTLTFPVYPTTQKFPKQCENKNHPFLYLLRALPSNIMDVDNNPALPLNCFICDDPETPAQKLGQATSKGCLTLLACAGVFGNATILVP